MTHPRLSEILSAGAVYPHVEHVAGGECSRSTAAAPPAAARAHDYLRRLPPAWFAALDQVGQQDDGDGGVLELALCPACGTTVAREHMREES